MAIEDRNLKVGTRLVARYKGQEYHCEVTDRGEGKLGYTLMDSGMPKNVFKSPSAVGSAIIGTACNGWRFWSVEGSEEAKPKVRGRKRNGNSKTVNLTHMDNGRWFCSTCQEAFDTNELEPTECPKGHKQEEVAIA